MRPHEELELRWAEWNGLDPKGMVACSSGTAALHLALEAFGDGGRHVLVPDFTMIAVARAVSLAGKEPVFVDCRLPDLNIDPELVWDYGLDPENNAHGSLSAVMAVHTYGRRPDLQELGKFCDDYGVRLVEDLAEAHGTRPHGHTDAACWSFYRNKIIHGEEGGAVWFRDPRDAIRARSLRCLGFTDDHDFLHTPRGHNYRMADPLARPIIEGIGIGHELIRQRRAIEQCYDRHCPSEWKTPPRDAPWVYDIRLPAPMSHQIRTLLVRSLNTMGVEARHSFRPMTEQEEYRRHHRIVRGRDQIVSNSTLASIRHIYLPLYGVTENQIKNTFLAIKDMLTEYR